MPKIFAMVINRELQESRMRGYFIEAARETLKGEGLRAVNVRTVSERAGFSYATLYNYFKDLNELIFFCVQDFMNECEAYVNERSAAETPGKSRLIRKMKSFIEYFTQYQGVFELFYTERMNDRGNSLPAAAMIYEFTDRISNEDIAILKQSGLLTDASADLVQLNLRNSIAGLLLFYNNRLQPAGYNEFTALAEQQINFSLNLIS